MWAPDYFVRYLPFPSRVGAVVIPNDDGSFDIYISSQLTEEAQALRLEHELKHIRSDHFYREIPVFAAEAEAQGHPAPVLSPPVQIPTLVPAATVTEVSPKKKRKKKEPLPEKHIPLYKSVAQFEAVMRKYGVIDSIFKDIAAEKEASSS